MTLWRESLLPAIALYFVTLFAITVCQHGRVRAAPIRRHRPGVGGAAARRLPGTVSVPAARFFPGLPLRSTAGGRPTRELPPGAARECRVAPRRDHSGHVHPSGKPLALPAGPGLVGHAVVLELRQRRSYICLFEVYQADKVMFGCGDQIVDVVNIGANFEYRTEDARGPTRTLKLCFTDGHQLVFGFEFQWLPQFSVQTPRGSKVSSLVLRSTQRNWARRDASTNRRRRRWLCRT